MGESLPFILLCTNSQIHKSKEFVADNQAYDIYLAKGHIKDGIRCDMFSPNQDWL
jgi:hypothetical protein